MLSAKRVRDHLKFLNNDSWLYLDRERGMGTSCPSELLDLISDLEQIAEFLGDPDLSREPLDNWTCPNCNSDKLELWEGPYYTVTPVRETMMGLQARWDPNKGWDELAPAWDSWDAADMTDHNLDRAEFIVCQDCGSTYRCKVIDGDYIVEIGGDSDNN